MNSVYQVGSVLEFNYLGKIRRVRIEKVKVSAGNPFVGPRTQLITGWDYMADLPTGGYRSFKVENIRELEVIRA